MEPTSDVAKLKQKRQNQTKSIQVKGLSASWAHLLMLRQDVYLYNTASDFVVSAMRLIDDEIFTIYPPCGTKHDVYNECQKTFGARRNSDWIRWDKALL